MFSSHSGRNKIFIIFLHFSAISHPCFLPIQDEIKFIDIFSCANAEWSLRFDILYNSLIFFKLAKNALESSSLLVADWLRVVCRIQ